MRRSRLPRLTAIVLAALAAVLVLPGSAHQASAMRAARPRQPGRAGRAAAAVTERGHGSRRDGGQRAVCARCRASVTSAGCFGFCSLGSSGLIGALNNLCQPALPQPGVSQRRASTR